KQRARTPNQGFYRIQGASPQDKPVKIKFDGGDIKRSWADDGDVEVIALLAWADLRMQIRAVDEAGHVATLSGNARPSNTESQAAIASHGEIRAEGAVECAIEDCTFTHLAGYALELGRGCQRNRIVGNEMVDVGAGGVRIGESIRRPEGFDENSGQILTDNH